VSRARGKICGGTCCWARRGRAGRGARARALPGPRCACRCRRCGDVGERGAGGPVATGGRLAAGESTGADELGEAAGGELGDEGGADSRSYADREHARRWRKETGDVAVGVFELAPSCSRRGGRQAARCFRCRWKTLPCAGRPAVQPGCFWRTRGSAFPPHRQGRDRGEAGGARRQGFLAGFGAVGCAPTSSPDGPPVASPAPPSESSSAPPSSPSSRPARSSCAGSMPRASIKLRCRF
jgi:hypothetical protein